MSHSDRRTASVLFVGDDWYGSNATSLRDGFKEIGASVVSVDTSELMSHTMPFRRKLARKASPRLYGSWTSSAVARGVSRAVDEHGPFDHLVVFKGLSVPAEVVSQFRGTTVHYHPDDVSNDDNTSPTYLQAESSYDLHVTTKRHNVEELRTRSGAEVLFVPCAYDSRWHTDNGPAPGAEGRLGFVGTKRPDRVDFISMLAREEAAAGRSMLLAGTGWSGEDDIVSIAETEPAQFGSDFSLAVSRARLQLGVLNSANRDTHTCRTYEIPAAGGLFVGESTEEHLELFEGSAGALLYSSDDEARDLIRWARAHPGEAEAMRSRGHQIVTRGQNTYADRAREILRAIEAAAS